MWIIVYKIFKEVNGIPDGMIDTDIVTDPDQWIAEKKKLAKDSGDYVFQVLDVFNVSNTHCSP